MHRRGKRSYTGRTPLRTQGNKNTQENLNCEKNKRNIKKKSGQKSQLIRMMSLQVTERIEGVYMYVYSDSMQYIVSGQMIDHR